MRYFLKWPLNKIAFYPAALYCIVNILPLLSPAQNNSYKKFTASQSTTIGTGNSCAYANAGSICVSCDILQAYINEYFNGDGGAYSGQQLDAGTEDGMLTYIKDQLQADKQMYVSKESIAAALANCNTTYAQNVGLVYRGAASWVFGKAASTKYGGDFRAPANLQLGKNNFSLECWAQFKAPEASASNGEAPGNPPSQAVLAYANTNFYNNANSTYTNGYNIYWKAGFKGYYLFRRNGYLHFMMGDGTYTTDASGTQHGNIIWIRTENILNNAQWYHISITRAGNTASDITIYINGEPQNKVIVDGYSSLGTDAQSGDISLPNAPYPNKQSCGLMLVSFSCNSQGSNSSQKEDVRLKDLRIFTKLLSSIEVSNHYQSCGDESPDESQIALWAKLSEGTGNVLDASLNNTQGFWLGGNFTGSVTGDYKAWAGGNGPAQSPQCKVNNVTALCYDVQNDWPTLCGKTTPVYPSLDVIPKDNCDDEDNFAVSIGTERYQDYIESLKNDFMEQYKAKCLTAYQHETLTVTHAVSEYHYTLYYYDQAGNLVMTLPPKAVVPDRSTTFLNEVKTARANGTLKQPAHNFNLATRYRYNTLNQVIAQHTPDAGKSNFYYDRLGRLALSKNAKQAVGDAGNTANKKYSYTKYDALGRISEVGELKSSTVMNYAKCKDETQLQSWMDAADGTRTQITKTYYDREYPVALTGILVQQNLRSRVSWTALYDDAAKADAEVQFSAASIYSYDIHGNVDVMLQDYGNSTYSPNAMNGNGSRYKKITYNYDLISGKVNMVSYQPRNKADDALNKDAFYHRYTYDAENRLTDVETSSDSIYWEHDAYYKYYKHGPLARMEIGDNKVQGLDYAYTLQGWLKGVNSTAPGSVHDMGTDGYSSTSNADVARDVFGFALYYYGNSDYKPIKATETPFVQAPLQSTYFKPLYNGNIAAMVVNINAFGVNANNGVGNKPMAYMYSYDQLNRLTAMQTVKNGGTNFSGNNWTNPTAINDYKENIAYDANGNILTYSRYSNNATLMDNLTYNYAANTNKLKYVQDAVSTSTITTDIENQGTGNYDYDEIGNLIQDNAEGISNIEWTVYGKIKAITKGSTTIAYTYDASGNRISKKVTGAASGNGETWYVRDASGNTMAVYTANDNSVNSGHLTLSELTMYGSSRLGIVKPNTDMQEPGFTSISIPGLDKPGYLYSFVRGNKFFELSNHLGNVMVVVSDRRKGVFSGSTLQYYTARVVSASDYAPFGMVLNGRTYTAASYRYGFNGQEKSTEINENLYTAEYWEYDSRIGRRWNIDPKPKEYESPYAVLGNNPIWNIDPNGADTVKAISNAQLVDAIKIASNEVKNVIKNQEKYFSDAVKGRLLDAAMSYWEAHQTEMNFGSFTEFKQSVDQYYNGLATIAWWSGQEEFNKLDRTVINNKGVNNFWTAKITAGRIREVEANMWGILAQSAGISLFIASAGVAPEVGKGPNGVFISNTQRAIVESQAGVKFSDVALSRYLSPARTVNAAELRSAISTTPYADPQGAAGYSAYYTTILKNNKAYNLKVVYNEGTNTIVHFHYSRSAMGPLGKIRK